MLLITVPRTCLLSLHVWLHREVLPGEVSSDERAFSGVVNAFAAVEHCNLLSSLKIILSQYAMPITMQNPASWENGRPYAKVSLHVWKPDDCWWPEAIAPGQQTESCSRLTSLPVVRAYYPCSKQVEPSSFSRIANSNINLCNKNSGQTIHTTYLW